MTERVRLLAGSLGPERRPARLVRDDADWFLPLHVRDSAAARERVAAQVAAGADVVVAPTWLTHRRALSPLGETRRAAAWTAAAVTVARDGVEIGLERRVEALAGVPDDDVRHGRPAPLVAAVLPGLDDAPEAGTGRLLPREAAAERDYRDQAGYLADAEPDVLLVEGQQGLSTTRMGIAEAAQTGLPTWAALGVAALAEQELEAWLAWGLGVGLGAVLLPPPLEPWLSATGSSLAWGGLVDDAGAVAEWLAAGARIIARLDGATVGALAPLRSAIDDHEREAIEAARDAERRWAAQVARAASMAPGGAALWIGEAPSTGLPDGFDWLVVETEELPRVPREHYRLVVAPVPVATLDLLERGGVLAIRGAVGPGPADASLVFSDEAVEPPLRIYRREG